MDCCVPKKCTSTTLSTSELSNLIQQKVNAQVALLLQQVGITLTHAQLTALVEAEVAEALVDIGPLACFSDAANEAALIALNTAGVGGIYVIDDITLTADIEIDIPIWISPCGSIITNGHTLTISNDFSAGMYRVFDVDAPGEVEFSAGTIEKVYSEWFGAVGNQSTDCSPAINAAIASIGTNQQGTLCFLPGLYDCHSSIDCTMLPGLIIQGAGQGSVVRFIFDVPGGAGLDLTGSNRVIIKDMWFKTGQDTSSPAVVCLLARAISGASAAWHRFENCIFQGPDNGTTCKAALYAYGTEDLQCYSCSFYASNEGCVCIYFTCANTLAVASAFTTIDTNTDQSTAQNSFIGGDAIALDLAGTHPVLMRGTRNISFTDMGFVSGISTDYYFYLDSDLAVQTIDTFSLMQCRFEWWDATPPKYMFKGADGNLGVSFGSIIGNSIACTDAAYHQYGNTAVINVGQWMANRAEIAPEYLIDTDGTLTGGNVETNYKIRAGDVVGGIYSRLSTLANFIVSGSAQATLLITDSTTENQISFNNTIKTNPTGIFPIVDNVLVIGEDTKRFNEVRALNLYTTNGTLHGVFRMSASKTQIGSQDNNNVQFIHDSNVVGEYSATKMLWTIGIGAVLAVHANNAAALAGGLVAGDFYRTNADPDTVCVVH